jgi:hypothetical protein
LLFAFVLALGLAVNWISYARADVSSKTEQIEDLSITRIAPTERAFGEKIWIVIQIENKSSDPIVFQWIERLGNAEFDQSQAHATQIYDPGYGMDPETSTTEGFTSWTYEWKIRLDGGHKTYLTYWLVPTIVGDYVISPAQVVIGGLKYQTASWVINVQCQVDGVCQASDGENHLTCPDDCVSGNADNICEAIEDGVVDPDCEAGYDPDEAMLTEPTQAPSSTVTAIPTEEDKGKFPAICTGASLILVFPLIFLGIRFRRTPHQER